MAELSLTQYLNHIEQFIRRQSFDEAIAHSRHILARYPKNAAAYRSLAQALMAQSRWEEARDIWQRLVAALPDNVEVQRQLAETYTHLEDLNRALFHLERAFDLNPNDTEILAKLRALYTRKSGKPVGKIQLTAAAAAGQYLKNQLHDQAITALRKAIDSQGSRVDLQLLLAKALWEKGRTIDAAEKAMDVLKSLPFCVSANRILAELWLNEQRPTDAQRYLSRIEEVDPYLALEVAGARPEEDTFLVEVLNYRQYVQQTMSEQAPDWLSSLDESSVALAQELQDVAEPPARPEPAETDEMAWLNDLDAAGEEPAPARPEPEISMDDLFGDMEGDEFDLGERTSTGLTSEFGEDVDERDLDDIFAVDSNDPFAEGRTTGGLTGILNRMGTEDLDADADDSWLSDVTTGSFDTGTFDTGDFDRPKRTPTGLTGMLDNLDNLDSEPEEENLDWLFDAQTGAFDEDDAPRGPIPTVDLGEEDDPEINTAWIERMEREQRGEAAELSDMLDDFNLEAVDQSAEDLPDFLSDFEIEEDEDAADAPPPPTTSTGDLNDPDAWLRQSGIEFQEDAGPAPKLFDDINDGEAGISSTLQDPMAWMRESGVEADEEQAAPANPPRFFEDDEEDEEYRDAGVSEMWTPGSGELPADAWDESDQDTDHEDEFDVAAFTGADDRSVEDETFSDWDADADNMLEEALALENLTGFDLDQDESTDWQDTMSDQSQTPHPDDEEFNFEPEQPGEEPEDIMSDEEFNAMLEQMSTGGLSESEEEDEDDVDWLSALDNEPEEDEDDVDWLSNLDTSDDEEDEADEAFNAIFDQMGTDEPADEFTPEEFTSAEFTDEPEAAAVDVDWLSNLDTSDDEEDEEDEFDAMLDDLGFAADVDEDFGEPDIAASAETEDDEEELDLEPMAEDNFDAMFGEMNVIEEDEEEPQPDYQPMAEDDFDAMFADIGAADEEQEDEEEPQPDYQPMAEDDFDAMFADMGAADEEQEDEEEPQPDYQPMAEDDFDAMFADMGAADEEQDEEEPQPDYQPMAEDDFDAMFSDMGAADEEQEDEEPQPDYQPMAEDDFDAMFGEMGAAREEAGEQAEGEQAEEEEQDFDEVLGAMGLAAGAAGLAAAMSQDAEEEAEEPNYEEFEDEEEPVGAPPIDEYGATAVLDMDEDDERFAPPVATEPPGGMTRMLGPSDIEPEQPEEPESAHPPSWLDQVDDSIPVEDEPDWLAEFEGDTASLDEEPDWLANLDSGQDEEEDEFARDVVASNQITDIFGDTSEEEEAEEELEELADLQAAAGYYEADELEEYDAMEGDQYDELDELEALDEFDTFEEAEPVVDAEDLSAAAANNAPDWLNQLVPGLDLDFDAREEILEKEAEGEEESAHRRRAVTPDPVDESNFGWLLDIVEEETSAGAPPPLTMPAPAARVAEQQGRFAFSQPPLWMRNGPTAPEGGALVTGTMAGIPADWLIDEATSDEATVDEAPPAPDTPPEAEASLDGDTLPVEFDKTSAATEMPAVTPVEPIEEPVDEEPVRPYGDPYDLDEETPEPNDGLDDPGSLDELLDEMGLDLNLDEFDFDDLDDLDDDVDDEDRR